MMRKRFFILSILALYAVTVVMGQSNSETSIEESYLQEAIELMIIYETSRSSSREQKMLALEHIKGALDRGSTNDEIRVALEYLSLDGTQNRVREAGRLTNNHPDVRQQAAKYLGTVGTTEAKNALIKVCTTDNEPMVLQEAIKSLGTIGLNDDNDAVNAVVWATTKNLNTGNPDSILAIATLDTLEKLTSKYRQTDLSTIHLVTRMLEANYPPPVREKARQLLINMRKGA
jgi:HEAT repeat protein